MNIQSGTWQYGFFILFGALVVFCALGLVISEIRERRRDAKNFRINPLFSVGHDCKGRS